MRVGEAGRDLTMTDKPYPAYISWLSKQIEPNRQRNFDELFHIMHEKTFVYTMANDDSRIQDAHDVRLDYFRNFKVKSYVSTDILGPISVLEILIALSRRMGFMTSSEPSGWAWVLLKNLELSRYSGRVTRKRAEEIDEILERLIWRHYGPDGGGGFFPLAWPEEDQRKVELWYQMAAYLAETEDPHDY